MPIFFIIVLLLSQSFAPIMAMQNEKKTASAELVVQNNSAKLVFLNVNSLAQHIYPNRYNYAKAFLLEKSLGVDICTHAGIFCAFIDGKFDRYGYLRSADILINKYEAAEPGQPEGVKTKHLWLRDIPGTGSKVIATVGQDGLISLALAPKTP